MNKIWCRNNLVTIGKWGGISFLLGAIATAFVFKGNIPLRAYVSDTISTRSYQQTEFKLNLNPINKVNDITAPINGLVNSTLNSFKFNQGVMGTRIPLSPIKSPSQNIDFSRFFSSSKVSSNDITSFLKEATITGINLTILIISITSQVLKGLLSVLR